MDRVWEIGSSDDSGVTLVELVFASAILLISAAGVLSALMFATTATTQSAVRQAALSLANLKVEQARNLPYDDVGTFFPSGAFGNPRGSIPVTTTAGPFAVSTKIDWSTDPVTLRSMYKNIRVTVSWQRPRPGSISVASAIYGRSNLVNVGDLRVRVRDEKGDPIPGAMITLNSSGIMYAGSSAAGGEAFFGGLSAGPASATVDHVMYAFDTSDLTSITIVPELVTERVVVGYLRSRVVITVLDENGSLLEDAKISGQLLHVAKTRKWFNTGSDGQIVFDESFDLFPGEYSVTVGAPNRTDVQATLYISKGGDTVYLTVSMGAPVLPGSLTVKVRDPNGLSLNGALVVVSDLTTSTALLTTNGEAVFAKVSPGEYAAAVSLSGYASRTVSATVLANAPTSVTATLTPAGGGATTGSLRIIVYNGSGVLQPGVSVRVTYPNNTAVYRTTDSRGEVLLGNLVPGTYGVRPSNGSTTYHGVLAGQETLAQTVGWR